MRIVFRVGPSVAATPAVALVTMALVAVALIAGTGFPAHAKEATGDASQTMIPPAPRLLPADTLAYIAIRDAEELRAGLADSSVGKMLDDPQMRPFASDFFATASAVFDELAQQANVSNISLDELLALPSGQVTLALLPGLPPPEDADETDDRPDSELTDQEIGQRLRRKRRSTNSFAGVLIVDAGDRSDKMQELMDSVGGLLESNGLVLKSSTLGSVQFNDFRRAREDDSALQWFREGDLFVVGFGRDTAKRVHERMHPASAKNDRAAASAKASASSATEKTLSENADFTAVMSRSMGAEFEDPQLTFFVNPNDIISRLIARGGGAAFIQPIVKELGLPKIRGFGGSAFRGGDVVENITHVHVVIDPPRDGFFGVLRPDDVEITPPNWVPQDVGSYSTLQWDIETAFENLGKIVNRFAGGERFDEFTVAPLKTRLDIDLRTDLIANLTGRYVNLSRYQRPATFNSQTRMDALEVKDAAAADAMLAKISAKLPESFQKMTVAGQAAYGFPSRQGNRAGIRQPEPRIFRLENWLIFSDSEQLVELVVQANSGATKRLVNDDDFALLSAELAVKLDSEKPFFYLFQRDAEQFRFLYELAASQGTADQLRRGGENNPAIQKFSDLLGRQKLPDFDELKKYFFVSGIFATDEPGGIHTTLLNLRPIE